MAWIDRQKLDDLELIEEGTDIALDFTRFHSKSGEGVVPVAVQDVATGAVLLIAHVNDAALQHTLKTRIATCWSLSRDELWIKGATSGNTLEILDILVNCEQNSLLYRVKLAHGGACHTKDGDEFRHGCYYRRIDEDWLEKLSSN